MELPEDIPDYHKVAIYCHILSGIRQGTTITLILKELLWTYKSMDSDGNAAGNLGSVKVNSTFFPHYSTITRKIPANPVLEPQPNR
jgi:hypothetical protein